MLVVASTVLGYWVLGRVLLKNSPYTLALKPSPYIKVKFE